MNTKNKVLLSSLISAAVLSLTACGGGDSSDPVAQHPDPDFFSPTIVLNGEELIVIDEGGVAENLGATATDNVDPSVEVVTTGSFNTDKAGTYTIKYTATDLAGNTAVKMQTVKVIRGEEFNNYDGNWEIACNTVDESSVKLRALGITNLRQVIKINERNIKLQVQGFDNPSCAGTPTYKGTLKGRIVYTGSDIYNGSFPGEKVDLEVIQAHYSRADNNIIKVDQENLKAYAEEMGLPKYDVFAMVDTNNNAMHTGNITADKDGSSNAKRPVEVNLFDRYYKQ